MYFNPCNCHDFFKNVQPRLAKIEAWHYKERIKRKKCLLNKDCQNKQIAASNDERSLLKHE